MKKIILWIGATLGAVVFGLLIVVETQPCIFIKWRTEQMAGFDLPDEAKVVECVGNDGECYYRWKIPYAEIEKLKFPTDKMSFRDYPSDWTPYDGRYFGILTEDTVAEDAEMLHYYTDFWAILLLRSKFEDSLIVAGLYTN